MFSGSTNHRKNAQTFTYLAEKTKVDSFWNLKFEVEMTIRKYNRWITSLFLIPYICISKKRKKNNLWEHPWSIKRKCTTVNNVSRQHAVQSREERLRYYFLDKPDFEFLIFVVNNMIEAFQSRIDKLSRRVSLILYRLWNENEHGRKL